MNRKWLPMRYHNSLGYWIVIKNDTGYMMNCGKCFEIFLGESEWIQCRLEFGPNWYIVTGSECVELTLRKTQAYMININ
jgi:hypothetical protein